MLIGHACLWNADGHRSLDLKLVSLRGCYGGMAA